MISHNTAYVSVHPKTRRPLYIGIGLVVLSLPEAFLVRNWLGAANSYEVQTWRTLAVLYLVVTGGLILAFLTFASFDDHALQEHRRNTRYHAIHKRPPSPDAPLTPLQKNTRAFYRVHALQSETCMIASGGFVCLIVATLVAYNHIVTEIARWDWVNALGGFMLCGAFIFFIAVFYVWNRFRLSQSLRLKRK